jgi:hypothetical protein
MGNRMLRVVILVASAICPAVGCVATVKPLDRGEYSAIVSHPVRPTARQMRLEWDRELVPANPLPLQANPAKVTVGQPLPCDQQ